MKKVIAISLLLTSGFMYAGIVITYLGCKWMGATAENFCSCKDNILTSLVATDTDGEGHEAGAFSQRQGWTVHLFAASSAIAPSATPYPLPLVHLAYLRVADLFGGFMDDVFRPPLQWKYWA